MKTKIFTSLKIIIAAILATLTAHFLKLNFAVSAGIVAILSVQPTKKETLNTALSRLQAFIIALILFKTCSCILGFTYYAFFLYLIVFIFLCQFFKWYSAMAMDSVLISHFLTLKAFGADELKNEILLFVIGVGFGILANIFLRKQTDKIEALKKEADEQIKQILNRMSQRILDLDFSNYTGDCFKKLDTAILEAKIFAEANANNQLKKTDNFDQKYIEMRNAQKEVLQEIYQYIIELKSVPATAQTVSDFFKKVAEEYETNNDVVLLIEELQIIHSKMKEVKLPQNRNEFEDRALLFMMLNRMKDFLYLKRNFYISYGCNKKSIKS